MTIAHKVLIRPHSKKEIFKEATWAFFITIYTTYKIFINFLLFPKNE